MPCQSQLGKAVPTGELVGTTDSQAITNKTINIDSGGNSIVGVSWSVLYTDGSGVITELGLGTSGQILQSNGPSAAPSWTTASGGGNVSNTGTPVDGQIPVWTNSTTIEGDPSLTFDTTTNYLNINTDSDTGSRIYLGADDYITNNLTSAGYYLGGSPAITFATVGTGRNVEVGGASGEFGGTTPGSGVLKLPDVTTTPVGTLTGGGMLYVSGTNLFFHDDAGTAHNLTADGGGGNVSNTGTPVDNQVAVWTNSTTIEGTTAFTFDSSTTTFSVNNSSAGIIKIGTHNLTATSNDLFIGLVNSYPAMYITQGGGLVNVELFGNSGAFGGGTQVLRLNDVIGTPSGTLASGGLLYVSGTDLFFHDDAGTAHNLTSGAGSGNVSNTGTPANDQIAVWTNSTTIEGTGAFRFDDSSGDRLYLGDAGSQALFYINNIAVLGDNAGTTTLYNVDALDTTTEDTINKYTVESNVNTAWTLALGNNWHYIRASNASAITITVPPNSTAAFPIGSSILIEQTGAGAVTMSPGAGVTLNAAGSNLSTSAQYEVLQLMKVATDVWTVIGGTAT